MRYIVDHDFHIHSNLSPCSGDPEQTPELILQYAIHNGFKRICLTDHYWDANVPGSNGWNEVLNLEHLSKNLPLPQAEGVEFLFGCECEMDKHFTISIAKENYDKFDFIIVSTTHMHNIGFTIDEKDDNPKDRARLWVERFDAVLNSDLPFHKVGIAHLASTHMAPGPREVYLETLENIPSAEMERLFGRAAELGIGIEINRSDMHFSDDEADIVMRMFRIAKAMGCKFYMGGDLHRQITPFKDGTVHFERGVELLGLTEDDKFHFQVKI